MNAKNADSSINRRKFLRSSAAAGAGLAISRLAFARTDTNPRDSLNVAFIGLGSQGCTLMMNCLKMPNLHIAALCDIWKAYNQKRASRILNKFRHQHNTYEDYRQMLDRETDLHAVIIATPDFLHARQTLDCLNAGLHVYCERPMATDAEDAKLMVLAARKTGKLLQIGHHRRSNPRYIQCRRQFFEERKILGHISAANAFCHVSALWVRGWPRTMPIQPDTLAKYGYASMQQFANWRWSRSLASGVVGTFSSDQIDVFNWFFGVRPKSVMALGNTDANQSQQDPLPENVTAVYNYQTKTSSVRAVYQTITGQNGLNRFECFIGENAALLISDALFHLGSNLVEAPSFCAADSWSDVRSHDLRQVPTRNASLCLRDFLAGIAVQESHMKRPPIRCDLCDLHLSVKLDKPPVRLHLENFFEAIRSRGKISLNCPAEVGYETTLAVLKTNESVQAGRSLQFKPENLEI